MDLFKRKSLKIYELDSGKEWREFYTVVGRNYHPGCRVFNRYDAGYDILRSRMVEKGKRYG
jgi:hypothetical protein